MTQQSSVMLEEIRSTSTTTTVCSIIIEEPHPVLRRGILEIALEAGYQDVRVADENFFPAREDGFPWVLIASSDCDLATIEALRLKIGPIHHFLVVIKSDHPESLTAASRLRADAYTMLSELDANELSRTIGLMGTGRTIIPDELGKHLLKSSETKGQSPWLLSRRELEVLRLLAEGLSNKQIARRMYISHHGVKRHVGNLLAKMNCPNRTQAVARALLAEIPI